ncbi:hypothetical protein [Gorillibacterium massiliense]|uniref:hypothetical protein n=1 Tax=Gorillibacterium massiliense TaxID=1280390 RepID=UPI0005939AD3|nr:hypothetical protein [Gorillibacterium massiliense]
MIYYGIVIEQSLKNPSILKEFEIVAQKQNGNWKFLLVSASENTLENQIEKLQDNMIPINEDCWYSHFFMNDAMIVVYQDAVFKTTTNQSDWNEVIQYGTKHGVPIEQLDFNPCTKEGAFKLFDLK